MKKTKDLKYPKYPRPKYITHINNINTIYHLSLNNFPDPGAKDRGGKDGGDVGKPPNGQHQNPSRCNLQRNSQP